MIKTPKHLHPFKEKSFKMLIFKNNLTGVLEFIPDFKICMIKSVCLKSLHRNVLFERDVKYTPDS